MEPIGTTKKTENSRSGINTYKVIFSKLNRKWHKMAEPKTMFSAQSHVDIYQRTILDLTLGDTFFGEILGEVGRVGKNIIVLG